MIQQAKKHKETIHARKKEKLPSYRRIDSLTGLIVKLHFYELGHKKQASPPDLPQTPGLSHFKTARKDVSEKKEYDPRLFSFPGLSFS